jgi:hypothetical protein
LKIKLACWVVPHLQLENRCIKNLSNFSEILLVLYLFKGFILKWFFFKIKKCYILWHSKFLFAPTSKRSTPWCGGRGRVCVCVCECTCICVEHNASIPGLLLCKRSSSSEENCEKDAYNEPKLYIIYIIRQNTF